MVLPASFLLRIQEKTFKRIKRALVRNVLATHEAKVQRVSAAVRARVVGKKICTSRSPFASFSMRFSDYKAKANQIFVGDLDSVVSMRPGEVTIEPLVSVGEITGYLLKRGQMLATTLEVKDATIGGLSCAVAMTTASHKYGLLQDTVVSFRVVLADGRVITATETNEYSDLYHAMPWSHGSLCLLVAVTLKTIDVKPYVKVTYEPFHTMAESAKRIRELARYAPIEEAADFIEATLFTREQGVVMHGEFCEYDVNIKVNHVGKWYAPWFYTRVRDVLKEGKKVVELVPVKEYIFRHDRAIFWTLRDMLPESIGNSPLFRYTIGFLLPPKLFMLKMPAFTPKLREEMRTERVYQDIILPLVALEDSVKICADEWEIWPLLVYPSLIVDNGPGKRGIFPTRAVTSAPKEDVREWKNGTKAALFFDLGCYGIPQQVVKRQKYNGVKSLRKMEHFTQSVGGAPFLYADTFMTPQEFEKMFDLTLYRLVREKYGCQGAFFDLYEKTTSFKKGDDLL